MKRNTMQRLVAWKKTSQRLPLVIRGARQVGKTWLMREFGRVHFESVAYVNFDNNARMRSLFEGDFEISRLLAGLQLEARTKITPQTLLIFDEVQEVPQALASLKYFCENAPAQPILASGSMLGIALHEGTSFPVGKVDFLDLRPLDFRETLEALGDAELAQLLRMSPLDGALLKAFGGRLVERLRQYLVLGGMPEVVATFAESGDYDAARVVQSRILEAYEQDFSKHAPNAVVPRIRLLWQSIPAQLARENRRFIYGAVRHGARAKDFELAMQWLLDCGLLHRVDCVSKPALPLAAYRSAAFKLFMGDVGLLARLCGLEPTTLLEGNRLFMEFKGALTEQFVAQELVACGLTPFYWSNPDGKSEVDFVVATGRDVVPVEVKASENLQAKSLKIYHEKYRPTRCVRTSLSDYREEPWLVNVPLYGIGTFFQELKK
jgi:predicted AAA+ superfamily ATPase